ncbi:ATP-dependent DNA helicase DDM1 [Hondaea fermentalgiana]|uniref:ATP-dependent DNA helicase DDM1 n=1 Tax=Hondaea fermentalgiana TaxID=2315210 RepID=A0A2R5GKJ4_9STRA|nr:ATP-dependent DNA helicase DDM1 [Hondaea fermentalgiana]|eukprot:GBG28394.1 ATP-dependent DNA helicase DDM1 [Hondaea fermentalgiana]
MVAKGAKKSAKSDTTAKPPENVDDSEEKMLKKLEAEEEKAAEANDKDWKPEASRISERRAGITEAEASQALERLLAKAEKYTQFLNRKLMGSTLEEPRPKPETAAPASKRRKVSSSGAGKRVTADVTSSSKSKDDENDDDEIQPSVAPEDELDEHGQRRQPKSLTGGRLRDYQVKGFKWMVGLYENGLHGILADEMGLGKTVQTVAMIAHLRDMGAYGPYLIVVPLSTIHNWVNEIKKWAPKMPVLLYHGTKEERADMRSRFLKPARSNKRDLKKFPVTVTTYDIVCRDRSGLQHCDWKHIIVDEGHRLKNHKCKLIRELNQLCGGSVLRGGANKILLTGTPLQNNLAELWSLLNFLMPEIFDDLDFFQSVFAFDGSRGTENELVRKHAEENIVSKLHKILAPFMMRRLKSEVEKHLPSKKEVVVYIPMTASQRDMYKSIVAKEFGKLLELATGNKTQLNNVLMQLRKCCLHPYLHFEPTDATGNFINDQRLIDTSGKVRALDQMLTALKAKGHKVLVFSQFTSLLDIVQDYMQFLRPEWKVCRIDGSTSLEDRKAQMDGFNNDPDYFCFLLSTRAGGVGINLVSADTVIIFDSDWNPHQDNQAQDRAHRIGQTKDVMVYRMIAANSIELKILERANSKRKLERVVCAKQATINNSAKTTRLDADELRQLLRDDFTGHHSDVGEISDETLATLLDRKKVLSGEVPRSGNGYEIVEHQASSIVGSVNK